MKNNVWIAISFSMLAAASASACPANSGKSKIGSVTDKTEKSVSERNLIKSLKIHQEPTFETATPCYSKS